jgi:hypothetical protein
MGDSRTTEPLPESMSRPPTERRRVPVSEWQRAGAKLTTSCETSPRAGMIFKSNESKARGAVVIVLAREGDSLMADKADHVLFLPDAPNVLQSILAAIPLQLLRTRWRSGAVPTSISRATSPRVLRSNERLDCRTESREGQVTRTRAAGATTLSVVCPSRHPLRASL